ncbi:Metallo-dependent phosphatase [Xylariaceae sp. FL0662B]|nr:Metallo-dependent phosphatase [Xylariaceae sp. FL0662B]
MFRPGNSGLETLLERPRPSTWQLFLRGPCVFLAQKLYSWRRLAITSRSPEDAISVVCISDTHNSQCSLPDGDILIHAGDLTQSGSLEELQATISWLQQQPHDVKIVIAGNHDLLLDPSRDDPDGKAIAARNLIDWSGIRYLQDSAMTLFWGGRRINIYGSPKSPRHGNWAFQYARDSNVWKDSIPDTTDILITHCPPRAHLDLTTLGCPHLLRELWRVDPVLHVFGHVHEGYGHEWIQFDTLQNAYERTILAGGGIWNLLGVLQAYILSLFRAPVKATCQLVNPSMVGGLRDDVRWQAIKVYI